MAPLHIRSGTGQQIVREGRRRRLETTRMGLGDPVGLAITGATGPVVAVIGEGHERRRLALVLGNGGSLGEARFWEGRSAYGDRGPAEGG